MQNRKRAEILKQWALEAGFDRAGIARLEPVAHGAAFRRWLDRGEHASMEYLERRVDLRLDPVGHLEDTARSALCVALQYHSVTDDSTPSGDLWPRVARYARGRDYHELMLDRLDALAQKIEAAFPGIRTRPYVDTGPVLERELAARAGLGVIGKNTNLLHPEAGSWFFLGELFLTLDLEPETEMADLCGSCTRCLEACPTGALPQPYRLDSNRCISYWTIEHRGEIPAGVRSSLGDWVFGCDVCQEVCPVNEGPVADVDSELALPPHRAKLDLAALLNLRREEYVERFRGSAVRRAKQEGLQRNAAVAMGNRGNPEYLPALAEALAGGSVLVRRHAAWATGQIGGEAARELLVERLSTEEGPDVRQELRAALETVDNRTKNAGLLRVDT